MNAKTFLYDTFICHNSLDKTLIEAIDGQLRARGIRCWLDRYELQPGKNWQKFINSEWPRIASIILCFGKNGISPGQQYELDHLVPASKKNQHIVPIILPDVPRSTDAHNLIPDKLKDRIWIDFRDPKINTTDALIWGINGENPFIRLSIGNYYRDTDGLEDSALKQSLYSIIRKGQNKLGYPKAVREAAMIAFEDPENDENVLLFNDNRSVPKSNYFGFGKRAPGCWNLDHIWPKAFGFQENQKIISDMHNIGLTDVAYNSRRGAGFFYDRRLDFREKETEVSPTRIFDPRGFIARACLYMEVRYQGFDKDPKLVLDEQQQVVGEPHLGSLETLLYWNRLARVTPAERKRNDIIAERQGNRNPFIDRPEFADLIWYPV